MYVRKNSWVELGPGRCRSAPPRVVARGYGRRGIGAAAADASVPGTATWCDQAAWYNPLAYALCIPHDLSVVGSDIASSYRGANVAEPGTLPPALPPGLTYVGPSADNPNATYAGVDSSGTPVYVVPQTAAQNQAANTANWQQFFANYSSANPPPSSFSDTLKSLLPWVLLGVAGIVVVPSLIGGRR